MSAAKENLFMGTELVASYGASRAVYGITQSPPNRGERAPPQAQPCKPVLDLPTPEG